MTDARPIRRRSRRLLLACTAALVATAAQAASRDVHYGAVEDPAVRECDALAWRGDLQASGRCYAAILDGDATAAARAEAAWALNDVHRANDWFRLAAANEPGDFMIRVRWGDLFAATHQNAEAMNLYREVLDAEPGQPFAVLGAARVLIDNFESAAGNYLALLLDDAAAHPGASAAAWLLTARVALEQGNRDEANAALLAAEEIIEREGWPLLEAWSVRATMDLLDGVGDSAWIGRALEFNPRYGALYATAAHYFVITRRYREAIGLYRKAVELQPELATAHEQLGINLLRDNQVARAREHLEIAYREDPFSPATVNTLRLLDSFTNFRLIDDPPGQGGEVPVTLRLHRDEAAAIAPYAIKLVRDSIDVFSRRYEFELKEPVVVEMYPDHEDFAVRTAGMPGLGILGATFGYVVAMDSPSSRPAAQFQWGTTLWHEMAHVFTLEMTGHRVPRWFSEGVSVFEEWRSGPNAGVRIPMSVYAAMAKDSFLPIADLDEGFIRPTYENQVIVSYMQAGLVCDFIERRFGASGLRGMLRAFDEGRSTVEAVEGTLGMTPGAFDAAFSEYVTETQGTVLDALDDWQHGQSAIGERIAKEDWEGLAEAAAELIGVLPAYVESDSPYLALALAQEKLGQTDAMTGTLEDFVQKGGYDPGALRKLGKLLHEAGRAPRAIEVLQAAMLVDPLDLEAHGTLGDLLLGENRPAEAKSEFEIALALEPHDKATAWYRLARAEHALGNREASQGYLLQALDVAPNFRPAQRLLLQLSAE